MRPDKRGKTSHRTISKNPKSDAHKTPSTEIETKEKNPYPRVPLPHAAESNTKSFRRRAIQSNWEKYELDDEETSEAPDFTEYISRANLSSSHFRLESEADWSNDVQDQNPTNEMAAYLSLDCNDLIQSLSAIPFHTRLRLDAMSLFTDDQVDEMNKEAEFYQKRYLCSQAPCPPTQTASSLVDKLMRGTNDHSKRVDTNECDPLRAHTVGDSNINQLHPKPNSPTNEKRVDNKTHGNVTENNPSYSHICDAELRDGLRNVTIDDKGDAEDDELDMLLSTDRPQDAVNEDTTSPLPVSNKDLKKPVQAIHENEETTSDLEDWLDSVLDD